MHAKELKIGSHLLQGSIFYRKFIKGYDMSNYCFLDYSSDFIKKVINFIGAKRLQLLQGSETSINEQIY